MKISIVTPTYEAKGKGKSLLNDLLLSIEKQTYKNIEIIISDHSKDDVIKDYLSEWNDKLNIVYYRNERGFGNSSINMNEGIKIATGDFIKIVHMDDYFCNDNAIQLMVSMIESNSNCKWGSFAFNHFYENENRTYRIIMPYYYFNPVIQETSLIGCPSVSFFINDGTNFFDENMIIINDFDMHYRLTKKYGNPCIINEVCVTIRMHDSQVTSLLETYRENEIKEAELFKTKNI